MKLIATAEIDETGRSIKSLDITRQTGLLEKIVKTDLLEDDTPNDFFNIHDKTITLFIPDKTPAIDYSGTDKAYELKVKNLFESYLDSKKVIEEIRNRYPTP